MTSLTRSPAPREVSYKRMAGVGLGLAGTGAVVGSGVGTALLAMSIVFDSGIAALFTGNTALISLVFGGGFGAVIGAVFTPAAAMLLLRKIPLGIALGVPALGTLVGGLIGAGVHYFSVLGALNGGLLGFAASVVGTWLVFRRRR